MLKEISRTPSTGCGRRIGRVPGLSAPRCCFARHRCGLEFGDYGECRGGRGRADFRQIHTSDATGLAREMAQSDPVGDESACAAAAQGGIRIPYHQCRCADPVCAGGVRRRVADADRRFERGRRVMDDAVPGRRSLQVSVQGQKSLRRQGVQQRYLS